MKAVVMLKIINLVKSEFIKNYSVKKLIIISFIMLAFTILFVEVSKMYYQINSDSQYSQSYLDSTKREIDRLSNIKNRTLEEEYNLKIRQVIYQTYSYLGTLNIKGDDYRIALMDQILFSLYNKLAIEIYKENYNSPDIKKICNSSNNTFNSGFEGVINHICSFSLEEIDEMYQKDIKIIDNYTNILKSNNYYMYVKYQLDNNFFDEETSKLASIIVDNRVKDDDNYLSHNMREYQSLITASSFIPEKENEFKIDNYYSITNYKDYVRYHTYLKNEALRNQKIIMYSSEHQIPHDISFNYDDNVNTPYQTTKTYVNLILHYSIIVMILVSITSSGIISKEHSSGTIKNIITAPVTRWKILLSKFIYLILHTYIIWLIGLAFLIIYSGIKFGFTDLLTPKLIYINNHVVEVNYFIYVLTELLVAGIPVIFFLSVILFLSAITLNTTITTSITSVTAILSLFNWYICYLFKIKILAYIPFTILDMGFIYGRIQQYTNILKIWDFNYSVAIIISIPLTLIMYLITAIIYSKRDIKNI